MLIKCIWLIIKLTINIYRTIKRTYNSFYLEESIFFMDQEENTRRRPPLIQYQIGQSGGRRKSRKLDGAIYEFRPFELQRVQYVNTASNTMPLPRSGHRIVSNDKNIYCFGGYNPDNAPRLFGEFWKFNKNTRVWELLLGPESYMPRELASNAVIMENNLLMVCRVI